MICAFGGDPGLGLRLAGPEISFVGGGILISNSVMFINSRMSISVHSGGGCLTRRDLPRSWNFASTLQNIKEKAAGILKILGIHGNHEIPKGLGILDIS